MLLEPKFLWGEQSFIIKVYGVPETNSFCLAAFGIDWTRQTLSKMLFSDTIKLANSGHVFHEIVLL